MSEQVMHSTQSSSLADILALVLDKGVVIVGDIQIKIADVELLTIKIRLMICSVDRAMEMGINWWQTDSFLSSKAKEEEREQKIIDLEKEVNKLKAEI